MEVEAEGDAVAAAAALQGGRGSLVERARWIPLRLDAGERRLLRLLEAALSVSECAPRAPARPGPSPAHNRRHTADFYSSVRFTTHAVPPLCAHRGHAAIKVLPAPPLTRCMPNTRMHTRTPARMPAQAQTWAD